jgi:AbiV family abortive infection protein
MLKLKISRRKLEELAFQSVQNGISLHFDSILLLSKRSFGSAFALSVIASEEFGKGFAIEEMLFQAGLLGGLQGHEEEVLRDLLRQHKLKQAWFVSSVFGVLAPKYILKGLQRIQGDKNDALYVGVRRGNHQIVRPFLVSKSKASEQVRTVNRALIDLIERRLEHGFDDEVSDQVLRRRRLLKRLQRAATTI